MKHAPFAGLVIAALLLGGCQSLNKTAKNKSAPDHSLAQSKVEREVPWSPPWSKKKSPDAKTELPAELQAKFEKAKEKSSDPKTSAEWVAQGNQFEVGRNFAAATKAYESALLVDPVNADAHHRLGIMADMRQEYGTAEDHYKAALRQKPQDANLLSDFGYSHNLRGSVQQSERYLLQSLDLDPQHKQALKNLGQLYASQGRHDDALQAFRRLRPEAEAQQLMAQYFPKGRPIPDGDSGPFAQAGNAESPRSAPSSPQTEIDQATLKNMSQQEVTRLMEQRRVEAERLREQKALAEFRPELQPSTTQEEWERSHPPGNRQPAPNQPPPRQDWAQNSPAAETSRGDRSGWDSAPRQPSTPGALADHPGRQASPQQEYWSGAPLSQRPPANDPARQNPWPPNRTNSQEAPWGGDGQSGNPSWPALADAGPNDQQRNVMRPGDKPWDQPAGGAPSSPRGAMTAQLTPNQRAWQLGMSAGPGTMFPAMSAEAAPPAANQRPAEGQSLAGPQWSNSTSVGGYQESRASAPADNAGNSPANSPWQSAPTEVAPRSPSDGWGSPSTVPWPDTAAAEQPARGAAPPRQTAPPATPQLPTITPSPGRASWADNAAARSDEDRGTRSGSDVVPAWFGAPAADSRPSVRSGNATTVPQWPYAPR